MTATGNITGGNVITGGLVSATANITGGNIVTAGLVTATGNVRGGNITTGGAVSATGAIAGAAITGTSLAVSTGNITGGNANISGTTAATSTTTGALIVGGGAGIAGNVAIGISLGVGTAPSGTTGEIRASNNITAFFSSDSKFKENIRPIPDALDKVMAIGGKLFDWTNEYVEANGGEDGYFVRKSDFGVVAQDVQNVFPPGVRTRPDGTLAVDYEKLAALAFAAIIELNNKIGNNYQG
jgi:hypothetical protein